jgi:integrase
VKRSPGRIVGSGRASSPTEIEIANLSLKRKGFRMASISVQPGGRRTIQFVAADGKRRSIRLGKATQKIADSVKVRVEQLNSIAIAGHVMDDETARWLAKLDNSLLDKLAAVGLIPRREVATLKAFLDGYVASRPDLKESTKTVLRHTSRCLVSYFGAAKPLRDITAADADDWRIWLKATQRLSDTTISRRCGIAKQFFRAAVRRKLLIENPFGDLKSGSQVNDKRMHFVTRDDAQKILAACPDAQWRLIFALSRFGGLRCPSEHVGIRWQDIDWAANRMTVRSPKTEHHPGSESRTVPIFPELLPHLQENRELAEEGAEFVVTRYREATQNLRTTFEKIIKRAGLKPWPKLFANLRASRATELAAEFPGHVAAEWLGHSMLIAQKHYWQVTEGDFARAAKSGAECGAVTGQSAVQNPVQQAAVPARTPGQETQKPRENQGSVRLAAKAGESLRLILVGDEGLEPPTLSV